MNYYRGKSKKILSLIRVSDIHGLSILVKPVTTRLKPSLRSQGLAHKALVKLYWLKFVFYVLTLPTFCHNKTWVEQVLMNWMLDRRDESPGLMLNWVNAWLGSSIDLLGQSIKLRLHPSLISNKKKLKI